MSSVAGGFPDWQRITQWFGSPLDQATAFALGAGAKTVGPLDVRNFASIVVCVRPVGGNVTVTVQQIVPAGPANLVVSSSFTVNAGNVVFESFVLLAGAASITFQGTAGGETLDYAVVPSNVNTNAAISQVTQLGFQHNAVVVANETAIDFEDADGIAWTLTDDPGNNRVKVSPSRTLAYAQFTSPVSIVHTADATADTIVSSGAAVYPAGDVWLEFFSVSVGPAPIAGDSLIFVLYDGALDLGRIGGVQAQSGGGPILAVPLYVKVPVTLTAGTHTLIVKAFDVNANGVVSAGVFGTPAYAPGWIRVSRK